MRDFDVAALDRAAAPIEDVLRSTGLSTPQVALALQDFTIPALHVGDLSIEAHERNRPPPTSTSASRCGTTNPVV
ncbi:hypothetical protein GS421_03220 [Rhodococcus hoagii]|nr:hypothetical protein [Prescottella equi]